MNLTPKKIRQGISAVVKVGTLPRGTYIMAIQTQQGVSTKKLVVE